MAATNWLLTGNSQTDPARDFLGTSDSQPLVIKTTNAQPVVIKTTDAERLRVDPAGHIGLGTATPAYSLHLAAGKALRIEGGIDAADSAAYLSLGEHGAFIIDAPAPVGLSPVPGPRFVVQNSGNVGIGEPNPAFSLHLATGKALRVEGATAGADPAAYLSVGDYGAFHIDAPGVPGGRFVVQNSGNVGIGEPSPAFSLHLATGKALRVEGGTGASDAATYFSFGSYGAFSIDAPGTPAGRFVVDNSGNVGIGTASPASKLHVAGDITVTGDVLLTGADCAEQFDLAAGTDLPEPGTVMVLGDGGGLAPGKAAYDRKVVGVVSGAGDYRPAIVLDKSPDSSDHRVAVALAGKVYCKVDPQYGPVAVGDLLTTSPTPGHAMKATDAVGAFGSVVGKALQALDGERGLIPIVVALQ